MLNMYSSEIMSDNNTTSPTKPGSHIHLALANDHSSICSCMKDQTMANSRVETNGCNLKPYHQDSRLSYYLHACLLQHTM